MSSVSSSLNSNFNNAVINNNGGQVKVNAENASAKVDNATNYTDNMLVSNNVTRASSVALTDAIDTLNQAAAMQQRNLSFSMDDLSGRAVIQVKDKQTNEVIKQIPSEELLKVAQDVKRLQNEMGQSLGLLVDNRV